MKCADCNKQVEETFLGKIVGTTIGSGKARKTICNDCQRKQDKK